MMNETPDGSEKDKDTSRQEEEIAILATLIAQARELVATGHTIDLAGLSEKVGNFCTDIAENPPVDAESVTAMIEVLVEDLKALAEEMTELHEGQTTNGDEGANS
jgi:N-acetylglutamate synthase/N-acetylornithine aminotransferase